MDMCSLPKSHPLIPLFQVIKSKASNHSSGDQSLESIKKRVEKQWRINEELIKIKHKNQVSLIESINTLDTRGFSYPWNWKTQINNKCSTSSIQWKIKQWNQIKLTWIAKRWWSPFFLLESLNLLLLNGWNLLFKSPNYSLKNPARWGLRNMGEGEKNWEEFCG